MITPIDLTHAAHGVYVLPAERRVPEGPFGTLASLPLRLPEHTAISHFAAFQRQDPAQQVRTDQAIGGGANRMQGLRIDRWSEAIEGGMFAILQRSDGGWLAMLPLAGPQALAWLAPEGEAVCLRVGTLGTEPVDAALPAMAWASDRDVYAACREVWRMAVGALGGAMRLRQEKPYPRIFRYLGWCSWEQYKREIDADNLLAAAKAIKASALPIRFALVDDGYLRHTEAEKMNQLQLTALGPNPTKFPNGFADLLAERETDPDTPGLRWFGLWQNFNGYWGRIAASNDLPTEINAHLMDVPAGGRLPKGTLPDAVGWYEAMVGYARQADFDFVKVDHQAANLIGYQGSANAAKAAACCSQALERAAAARIDGLINCMAHGPVNAMNTCLGAVTRCSEDYKVNDAWRAKAHLHNSYQNMLFFGPTVWGDHDMFHSNDQFAGRIMAVSKAVSGGPVYLSDDPEQFDPAHVWPLCFSDGELLRPLAPAGPLPRSVMVDPFEHGEPYIVAAPLPTGAAAIVAYNLTEPTAPVEGEIRLADHPDAAGLLAPGDGPWPETSQGVLRYVWATGDAAVLREPWSFTLSEFEDLLVLLCPIRCGWAVIGRADKYLSPAAVELRDATDRELVLQTREFGPITVWRDGELRVVQAEAGLVRIPA